MERFWQLAFLLFVSLSAGLDPKTLPKRFPSASKLGAKRVASDNLKLEHLVSSPQLNDIHVVPLGLETFDSVIRDRNKDVFVAFYTNWYVLLFTLHQGADIAKRSFQFIAT